MIELVGTRQKMKVSFITCTYGSVNCVGTQIFMFYTWLEIDNHQLYVSAGHVGIELSQRLFQLRI